MVELLRAHALLCSRVPFWHPGYHITCIKTVPGRASLHFYLAPNAQAGQPLIRLHSCFVSTDKFGKQRTKSGLIDIKENSFYQICHIQPCELIAFFLHPKISACTHVLFQQISLESSEQRSGIFDMKEN